MNRTSSLLLAGLALGIFVGIGLLPRGLSLYYQEQGGQLLEQALAVEGRLRVRKDPYLLLEPLSSEGGQRLAAQAAVHFQAAVRVDETNTQAYRWLGRTAMLIGDPEEAVSDFSTVVRRRPNNPLGYWELGLAYERLTHKVNEATRVEFAELDDKDISTIINTTQARPLFLSEAVIRTPEVSIDTPYCAQGEMPGSCFVALTEWEMPDAPGGQSNGWWMAEEPVWRAVLFMHPPSRAAFTVTLSVTPTALTFGWG